MAITVACSCGQRFAARDELAGKTVKCPKCSQPIKIPEKAAAAGAPPAKAAPAPAAKKKPPETSPHAEIFDEIGLTQRAEGMECPSCGEILPPAAVICIHCGYNFKLKRRMQTLGSDAPVSPGNVPGKKLSEVEKMLVRAEDDLEHEPIQQEKGYGTRWSAWLLFLLMAVIAGGIIGGGVLFFNYMEKSAAEQKSSGVE